jgi:hypothetical protein
LDSLSHAEVRAETLQGETHAAYKALEAWIGADVIKSRVCLEV